MKTVLQELIDELESIKGYKYGGLVIRLMKEKLEKEKEQICDSYVEGLEGLYMGAEEYYNKTFNQDRELGREVTDLLENHIKHLKENQNGHNKMPRTNRRTKLPL